METAYLQSFLLVVESGSMSEAARRLDLTPAAVAQQIRTLERELNAPLLARAGRTVQPTEAGHLLVQRARNLLREVGDIKTLLNSDAAGGELLIGTINTAIHSLLPDILARFVKTHPGVKVFLQSGTTATLHKAVQQGELDAAVCLYPPYVLAKTFDWSLLREEPLVLLAPSRLAKRDPHELLRTSPFIRYDRALGGGKQADRYLRAAGIVPQERFELSSLLAIAMMVDRGLGVSLVPDIASPLLDGQRIVKIPLPLPSEPRRFGVLWLRASPRQRLIRGFVDSAASVIETRGTPT
ncbi:DNA-binding transcriptional LysR family regulator [Variovorax boronicumulans]|uniref:DNA-binding transcriptional LysR family regulator n=1 Tax=Variovorax boronicumulans TaxID=436515 RepID=A0AAW8D499_9BURK|nr:MULTISPECIES: LysR family transcriptional regulator [Variovorax]MDP9896070.1 DNA-binding transcriptional LysR family regulator [Variovorax boronicumulans]MDP9989922.1 DNA-binding transcriptional LysR family regulator [Variovorax boronicumulans]MDQ0001571.1 DNA-binding transcriptional LysR family regulator [Variovorax boronicumulans]MDQ0056110.1 DNA-binding transcriptional LysR family regulator [Variovorax boronicumulans]MDQ0606786.1 DNA-binding transcriptional LysR family regulator [Variovo